MRLKTTKIDDLSQKILAEFKNHEEIAFRMDEEDVLHEIRNVITVDLQREDELEDEVREILQKHMNRIYRDDISYTDLVRKAKRQLAKERGLVL